MTLRFEWNQTKAKQNLIKHKVSFEEGKTIFNDPYLLTFPDEAHSDYEDRFIDIGISARQRILVAIHVERGDVIRLISCRKATAKERKFYEARDI